jgi:SAM-dependent MidA family methyltransferase
LIDYGHEAPRLFGPGHASGTLRTYRRHLVDPAAESPARPAWLADPGTGDLTAHVDFTAIGRALAGEGLHVLPRTDQTHFLLRLGLTDRLAAPAPDERTRLARVLAAKTLVVPGGLGSTHSALVAARGTSDPTAELGLC